MHQVLAGGEAFAVAAQFEGVWAEVVGDAAQSVVWVIGHQAMEAVLPAQGYHFQVVVLDALDNLRSDRDKNQASDAKASKWTSYMDSVC